MVLTTMLIHVTNGTTCNNLCFLDFHKSLNIILHHVLIIETLLEFVNYYENIVLMMTLNNRHQSMIQHFFLEIRKIQFCQDNFTNILLRL
jgi:hypothetical protein